MRLCTAMEKFCKILDVSSGSIFLSGTVPWKKIGEADEKSIALICDYYVTHPVRIRAWQITNPAQVIMAPDSAPAQTLKLENGNFLEVPFTTQERRLISRIRKTKSKEILATINEHPLSAECLRNVLLSKLTDEVKSNQLLNLFPV